jgi:hypothetical protein
MNAYQAQDAHQDDLDNAGHNAYCESMRIEQELIETGVSGDIDIEEMLCDSFPAGYALLITEMWKSKKANQGYSLAEFTNFFISKIDDEIQALIEKTVKEKAA